MLTVKTAGVLLAISLLSGCASPSYSRDNLTQQEFAADQSFCNARAQNISFGTGGMMGLAIFIKQKDMCMQGQGYTRTN